MDLGTGRTMLGSGTCGSVDLDVVKRKPFHVCAMWPLTVSSSFGK